MSDDGVLLFPIKPRPDPSDGPILAQVAQIQCRHLGSFTIDVENQRATCKVCAAEVPPFLVLGRLMHEEDKWRQLHAVYQDEMKRLAERSSTKCKHCGEMTRISRA